MALTRGAIAGFEAHAHVRLADFLGEGDGVRRQRDDGLGIAGAERPGAGDHRHEVGVGGGGADCAVDQKAARAAGGFNIGGERGFQIRAPFGERALAQRDAGRHGVAAALEQQTVGDRAPHRAADIDAGNGAAGASADAAGLKRDGKGRPAEFFLQPRRDEADDAGMPAFGGGDDDRAFFLKAERGERFRLGLRQRVEFDRLPLAIEPVEFGGNLRRLRRIVFHEQPHAEIGAADAAAGIDARAEQKAEMPRLGRAREPRHIHQARVPCPLAPAQRQQALGDEGAVQARERHHIGDGAERDIVEKGQQIRLAALAVPEAAAAQFAVHRDDRHEHEADGRQMTEPGEIVAPVRIDDRHRRRQRFRRPDDGR